MAHGKKTGGRKAGTPNKVTADIKTKIASLIDTRFDAINSDLDDLEPKDRVTAYLKLLEFVIPKQREQKVDLSLLTDEELDNLLNKALSKLE
ncbi:hypothetical protein [Spirosoma linguale]|uniref:Uncharacterized protein n=1 Tax=Spirosoma linguale (strain ATCC 33905 / DSM 74 / LMG 10896 / Claus 1) TaxID=504472 RepID=D2QNA7_SPILD|nr:hypothetical protein Slin_3285 [Spirosoma linguale DSM 74]